MKTKTLSLVSSVAIGSMATLALAFSQIQQAQAATITSLFNTGVDSSGVGLPDNSTAESHYTLIGPDGNANNITTRTAAGGFPIGTYFIGNESTSTWIGPDLGAPVNQWFGGNPGNYTYKTTFDLTGFDLNTVQIAGNWSTDNGGQKILLNGIDIGVGPLATDAFIGGFSSFSISNPSWFSATTNTLEFVVNNEGGPTALRTEFTATGDLIANANAASVPEPSDLVGTTVAFGSVLLLKRKLTKRSTKL